AVPGQVGRVPGDPLGLLVDGGELVGLHPPFHGIDVRLGDLRGRPESAVRDDQLTIAVCHVSAPSCAYASPAPPLRPPRRSPPPLPGAHPRPAPPLCRPPPPPAARPRSMTAAFCDGPL